MTMCGNGAQGFREQMTMQAGRSNALRPRRNGPLHLQTACSTPIKRLHLISDDTRQHEHKRNIKQEPSIAS